MAGKDTFARKVLVATSIIVLVVSATLILIYARTFFLLLFGGMLLGVFLRAIASWLSRKIKFLPTGLSLAFVILFLIGLITLSIILIAPTVGEQFQAIRDAVPESIAQVERWLRGFEFGQQVLEQLRGAFDELAVEQEQIAEAAGILSSTLGVLADILIIFVIGIFFAADPYLYRDGIVSLFPPSQRQRLNEVIHTSYRFLSLWLLGKFFTMAVVGILSGIGLAIMGVPMAIGLAFIAFLLDFIPNIGPIISAIPAMLIAFLVSPAHALYVALLFFVVQSIESYIFVPLIYKKTVSISPVMTLMSIVFFGIITGLLGIILATPIVVVFKVLIDELYIKDYLQGGGKKNLMVTEV
ncbi:AI-2E family transporter [Cytophagaceae bacterium ABcell3]|nr:AI-2E family transporter [Cytophagaceae bacterium ABcell3]